MSFKLDLERFAEKTGIKANTVIKKVAFDITNSVIDMSPVDTGRFKNNWNLSIGSINTSTTESTDLSGAGAMRRASASLASFQVGDSIYISNSLPYAQRLEDGYSTQAPSGMVKLTVVKYQSFVKEAVRSL